MPTMSQSAPCLWTPLPQSSPAPCDRYKHACCSHDAHVYVLGGRGYGGLRDFWRYSVVRNEWTELHCSGEAAPEELEQHSMVAHQGFLYVFGGLLDSMYRRRACPLWVFDVVKQKWVHWEGKTSRCLQTPSNRKGHSSVVLGSVMLLYGGLVDMKGSTDDFWTLDFDTLSWSLSPQQAPGGPGPRHLHSAVAFEGSMFLFGGLKGLREQRDFWKWSSSSNTWSNLKNRSGPSRLMGHCAVVYRDSMLVFGGGESHTCPENRLWSYSFTCQTWSVVPALSGSAPPGRIHHCCCGLGPSYRSDPAHSRPGGGARHFNNRCFPAPLGFLGSDGAIELETFGPERCYGNRESPPPEGTGTCLTFENKAFRTQRSEEQDTDPHLPDLLLVLGGRPWTQDRPVSTWQMTLTDS